MNTDTGHIVANIDDLPESEQPKYTKVPKRLRAAAFMALAGQMAADVDMSSDHPLAEWGRAQRGRAQRHNFSLQSPEAAGRRKAEAEAKRARRRERNLRDG